MIRIALTVVVTLAAPAIATAEIMVAESVEWMANDSPLIVIGNIATVKDEGEWRDVTVEISEVVKGDFTEKMLTFRIRAERFHTRAGAPNAPEWEIHSKRLLFLRKADPSEGGRELADRWTLRGPAFLGNSAVDLASPDHVYSMKMTPCTQPDEILETVREWASKPSPAENAQRRAIFNPPDGALAVEIPFDSAIYRMVWSGSACYLIVPAVEEFREKVKAMAASKHAESRARGALLLVNYPGGDTERLLNRLAGDRAPVYVAQRSGHVLKTVGEAAAAALEVLRMRATSQPTDPRPGSRNL